MAKTSGDGHLVLVNGEIHVWTVRVSSTGDLSRAERCLSSEERARAERFRFPRDRRTFVTTRCSLRMLLGGYLGCDPGAVAIAYGPTGKPHVAMPEPVRFNVSHSGAIVLLAFAADCELGIDVERVRQLPDMLGITRRFFCAEEAREVAALPQADRLQAFYRCWSRKEAYVKAIGDGLAAPFDEFRVTIGSWEPARFVHIGHDASEAARWTLHDLRPAPGYAAALAYAGPQRPVRLNAPYAVDGNERTP